MRTLKISDELYEQLKSFIVDPFDDTPEIVIGRLIDIARKAKSRWSPAPAEVPVSSNRLEYSAPAPVPQPPAQPQPVYLPEEQEIIL